MKPPMRIPALFATLFIALLVGCTEKDAQSEPATIAQPPQRPPLHVPFCSNGKISNDEINSIFAPLHQKGWVMDCETVAALAADPENGKLRDAKESAISGYGDLRESFLTLRNEMRKSPRKQALAKVEAMLPIALSRAAFPPWLGTPWAFYGASDTPGAGSIACGYFVAANLYAIGFNVRISLKKPGVRHFYLAGLASEAIIKKLVSPSSIQRFSNRPIGDVTEAIKRTGPGIYVVGLDYHVGFLVYDGEGPVKMWHSKVFNSVTLEEPRFAPFVSGSKYRVIGKLDARSAAIWLDGRKI